MVKSLPTMWETRVRSLGREDPLEKEIATHSSTLDWRIPWTPDIVDAESSNWYNWKECLEVKVKSLSHVQLFAVPWTVACQAPPSMKFSRQEYWSGLPFPSPEDLPDPGIELGSPAL